MLEWLAHLNTSDQYLLFGSISAILGFVLCWYYFRAKNLTNEMWSVDTYKAADLRRMCSGGFDAIVEVEGNVSCDQPITSLSCEVQCCYYHTIVERQVRGSKGQITWSKAFDRTAYTIFKISDDTGYVLIDPADADIELEPPIRYETLVRQPWFVGVHESETGVYRITESFFLPIGYAYVLGQASCTAQGTEPDSLIHKPVHGYTDANRPYYIISRHTEQQLNAEQSISLKISLWGSILAFLFTAYCIGCIIGILPSFH